MGYSAWGHKEPDTTEQLHFFQPMVIDAVRADERIGRRQRMKSKRGRVRSLKEHPHLTCLASCLWRTTRRPLLAQPLSSATALARPTLTSLPLALIPSIKKYQMPPEGSRKKKGGNSQDYAQSQITWMC